MNDFHCQEPRAKSQEPRAKSQEPRAKSQEPRAKSQALCLTFTDKLRQYDLIYKVIRFFYRIVKNVFWLPYILYYELRNLFRNDVVFIRCWSSVFRGWSIVPFNWGDELNKNFFEYITHGKKIIGINVDWPVKRYLAIGSILGNYNTRRAIVYGTGLLTSSYASGIRNKPEKIISVRGPRTRELLLQKGINCPAHYGDPALLLPMFYQPKHKGNKYISLIPHWRSYVFARDVYPISELTEKHNCRLIDITDYKKWTDFIDEVADSSFVMAESLHALIVAETYNIPCAWVYFTNHESGRFNSNGEWTFKFLDFYESIGKYDMQSIKLYEGYNFDKLMNLKNKWQPGRIDYEKLLEYFPFEIKPEFKAQIAEFLKAHKNSPES